MKSKIIRWYERHERAVNAIIDIACDAVPGGNVLKGALNIKFGIKEDKEEIVEEKKIEQLEQLLTNIQPQIYNIVEEIEGIKEFTQARDISQARNLIYKSSQLTSELHEIISQISPTLTSSVQELEETSRPATLLHETIIEGKYTLEKCLAIGGQGTVYYGHDTRAEREVAIKMLPEELNTNQHALTMLKREYRRLADKLVHKHIVQYRSIDFAQEKNTWCLIMDYINGQTLRQHIFEKPTKQCTVDEVYSLLYPIAQALDYAHTSNIIHCDLKPENIMISTDRTMFLTDFGLSQEAQQSVILASGAKTTVAGTLPYMAPEQYKGWGVSKATDIWSLGVIIYELLEGRHPFYGTSYEHYKDVICNEEPRPIADTSIWKQLQQALEKNEKDRIHSASTLVEYVCNKTTPHKKKVVNLSHIQEEILPEYIQEVNSYMDSIEKYKLEYTVESYKKAYQYTLEIVTIYKQEIETGNIEAMEQLGDFFATSIFLTDKSKSLHYHKMAAEKGKLTAITKTADAYTKLKHYKDAYSWYMQSVEQGDTDAMIGLGTLYEHGYGITQDTTKAKRLYQRAQEAGNDKGGKQLALLTKTWENKTHAERAEELYRKALKVNKDYLDMYKHRLKLQQKATHHTSPEALMLYIQAKDECNLGIDQKDHHAMFLMGMMYMNGDFREINYDEGWAWFEEAAEQGNPTAAYIAGHFFYDGSEHDKNYSEAIRYYQLAKDLGNTDGAYKLGLLYYEGQVVEKNITTALEYLREAAESGSEDAIKLINRIVT